MLQFIIFPSHNKQSERKRKKWRKDRREFILAIDNETLADMIQNKIMLNQDTINLQLPLKM